MLTLVVVCTGTQLLYTYPQIYDYHLPSAFVADNPDLTAVLTNNTHVTSAPWSHVAELVSMKGQSFTSFAKYKCFDAGVS